MDVESSRAPQDQSPLRGPQGSAPVVSDAAAMASMIQAAVAAAMAPMTASLTQLQSDMLQVKLAADSADPYSAAEDGEVSQPMGMDFSSARQRASSRSPRRTEA